MQLRSPARLALAVALIAPGATMIAQSDPGGQYDVDILVSYYDQDGDHSPVTGGIGTEDLQVISPVILLGWRVNDVWTLSADIGVDQISSASIGNIQMELSSASIPAADTRTFGNFHAERRLGNQTVGLTIGAAGEYDYESLSYGLDWSIDLNRANTSISAAVKRYDDAIDLVGIDGDGFQGEGLPRTTGSADRTTTDIFLTLSQTLGPRTAGSLEVFLSNQEGFLSTPFHEVILFPGPVLEGRHIAERLPDSRDRQAVSVRLNHAFSDRIVQRFGYRYYDDDWGITAHSIDLETHFRISSDKQMWVYPIFRYHTQTAADYFGLPGAFMGEEQFLTSDWDLAETSTDKYGMGWSVNSLPGQEWFLRVDRFEIRGTFYSRDDGLQGFTTSFGFGWTF